MERDVVNYDEYEGRIAAIPIVEVRARVRGHLIKINFQDGQIIKKDDLLFEIDPRRYKAELDGAEALKASAEASLKLAQATLERDTRLAATGAVSRQDLDISLGKLATSQADLRKTEAAIERAKLELDFAKIAAPITGKIGRAQVDVGNLVDAGSRNAKLARRRKWPLLSPTSRRRLQPGLPSIPAADGNDRPILCHVIRLGSEIHSHETARIIETQDEAQGIREGVAQAPHRVVPIAGVGIR